MMNPGSDVQIRVIRKGKFMNLSVKLGSVSEESATPAVVSQKLGIEVENMSVELSRQLGYALTDEGVVITKVKPGSPASLAGLRPGCLIQAINHKKVANTSDYEAAIAENGQNKKILLLVKYGKATRFYSIRIE
jgi:S1-C subfamily serine protease